MPHETPAGWYPAPHANDEPRYWDGQRWHDGAPTPEGAPTAAIPSVPAPPAPGGEAVPPALGGEPVPPAPAQPTGQAPVARNLAVAALVLGGAAFLTGLVPVLGLLLALGGVTLGILALVKKQPRGLAVTGLALGSVALLTSLIVTGASLGGTADVPTAAATEAAEARVDVTAPAEPQETEQASSTPEPEVTEAPAAPAAGGTIANPAAQPYVAKGFFGGDKYSLTARIVDANANALVEQWNMFNSEAPAGFKYVVVELAMTGIDPDGVEPSLASYDLSLATPEGNRYDNEYIIYGDGMPSMSDGPTLYPGSAFTGYTSYIVPEAAQSFLLYDNGQYIAL